ncbi:hypothetical protein KKC13_07595 [bacterium]|nr:hypothetical protein [bacterium]MBU1957073.1 hypothetical protein [bacterium]
MKNLEPNAIEQLLTIIPDHPANSLMEFSDGDEAFSTAIKNVCKERAYKYQLNFVDEELYKKSQPLFAEEGLCSVKLIKWGQRRYASMALQYYVVFVSATVPDEKKEEFLSNVLHHIKTSGHIVLLLPKNDRKIVDDWWVLLEEKLFVSISTLDVSDNCEILIARRMHGWGKFG